MATRRSRIKAVANLPARRSRPAASNDTLDSLCSEEKVLKSSEDGNNSIKSEQLQPLNDVQSAPDRKSVIVSVEKDRKSVIVNRGDCISLDSPQSALVETKSVGRSENEESQCNERHLESVAPVSSPSKQSNEKPSCISSPCNNISQNKQVPLRIRRAKPTVNLTAAARKRPPNEQSLSSPCSPPPCKVRPVEQLHHRNSESEKNLDSDIITNLHENSQLRKEPQQFPEKSISKTHPAPFLCSPSQEQPENLLLSNSSITAGEPEKLQPNTNSEDSQSVSDLVSDLPPTGSAESAVPPSPQKEICQTKRKPSVNAQRVAAARKSLKSRLSSDGAPSRASLTMFDLIFYNPSKNPMKSCDPSKKKSHHRVNSVSSVSSLYEDRLDEESIDDVCVENTKDDDKEEETAMPVPQVKVGPDGSLILDEQSLVIETTGFKKSREQLEKSEVIFDTGLGYGHYKKIIRSKDWSDHETKKFYRALNVVGTDFSLMKPYFRQRTRRELKLKFKKEEKLNPNLINKALAEPLDFDISELEKECELEEEEEKRLEEVAKEKASEKSKQKDAENSKEKKSVRKSNIKRSKLLRELDLEIEEGSGPSQKSTATVSKKAKRVVDKNADGAYSDLALGMNIEESKKKQMKNTRKTPNKKKESEPESTFQILVDLPEKRKKPSNKKVRRINSPEMQMEVSQSNEGNAKKPKVVQTYGKNITNDKVIEHGPSTSLSESPASAVPCTSSCTVLSGEFETIPTTPPSRIQIVQSAPLGVTPLASTTSSSIRTVKIVRAQPTPTSTSQASESNHLALPTSNLILSTKLLPPLQSVAIPQSPLPISSLSSPTNFSSFSPNSVPSTAMSTIQTFQVTPKAVSGTPVSRGHTIETTPRVIPGSPISRLQTTPIAPVTSQSAQSLSPGFAATTPISRCLPATPTLPRMEPGSIIVLKTPLPEDPNRHVLQVFMVTNTPQGTNQVSAPSTPSIPGISLLPGAPLQPAFVRSPCISEDSDTEKVLTKL